eukprot:TRINITY_DN1221_c0_g1_i3.p1 TRINITY_DN1221_c0_g1~~TRINITY_DN1221_c0_g1_i3.p1  ORF type:complete len:556 (+),score=112.62 TRINITY_DN1221_c0_g1_i3:550-2217(+)
MAWVHASSLQRPLFHPQSFSFVKNPVLTQKHFPKTPFLRFFSSSELNPPVLRDYQQKCIEECLHAISKGVKRQVVSLPVGSGKTVIFANLINKIPVPEDFPEAKKVLVLAHREELIEQAKRAIELSNPKLIVDIEKGELMARDEAHVIIASVPTLGRSDGSTRKKLARLERYSAHDFKCIIIDEAHHSTADTYIRILDHFKAREMLSHIVVWGCSATVFRTDGTALDKVFEKITFHKDLIQMMRENYLCKMRTLTISSDVSVDNINKNAGDFSLKQLSLAINIEERNALIIEEWEQKAHLMGRKSTLVFAVDLQHASDLEKIFRKKGYDARSVDHTTAKGNRSKIVSDFRSRKFPVLINCGIFTEGTDIPVIDCIVMARPTLSPVLFNQMIGRGLRLFPDKEDCLMLDVVDVFAKHPVMTIPSLFGLNPRFNMDGNDVLNIFDQIEPCLTKDSNVSEAKSLKEAFSIVGNIGENYTGSHFKWRKINENSYIHHIGSLQNNSIMKIITNIDNTFSIWIENEKEENRRKLLAKANSLKTAMDSAIAVSYTHLTLPTT